MVDSFTASPSISFVSDIPVIKSSSGNIKGKKYLPETPSIIGAPGSVHCTNSAVKINIAVTIIAIDAITFNVISLLTIIAKSIMMKQFRAKYRFNAKFFLYDELVRLSYNSAKFTEFTNIIKYTDLLVLDNIGSETGLKTANRSSVFLLENILRMRDANLLPTFISTNLDAKGFIENYSKNIFSFIQSNSVMIRAAGINIREENID